MKTGDIIEYQNRHDHSWEKARMVGELTNGSFVIECQSLGVFTRDKHEVRVPKVKVTRWVNVYRFNDGQTSIGGKMFHSDLVAISEGKANSNIYLATVPVTWEE